MVKDAVVLLHGLWFNGLDMTLLRDRLRHAGFDAHQFSYPTVRAAPRANAMALNAFTQRIDNPAVHFVAHSLGGLVVRHLFHDYPPARPGRVVTLGTPHQPSRSAQLLARWPGGGLLLGKSVEQGLLGNVPPWNPFRELGCIAGTMSIGFGRVFSGLPAPNDGTVAVAETRCDGMADHLVLPVSHFGLLLSGKVADAVQQFLRQGRFGQVQSEK